MQLSSFDSNNTGNNPRWYFFTKIFARLDFIIDIVSIFSTPIVVKSPNLFLIVRCFAKSSNNVKVRIAFGKIQGFEKYGK